jgi:signal peptidase II
LRVLYITALLLLSDQVTKVIVKGISIPFLGIELAGMRYGSSFNVLGDFFKITFVENPGMAFGIDVGDGFKLLLSMFSLVASVGIFIYLYKLRDDKLVIRLALALILAGALGNLIDRTFYGVFYGYAPLFYGKVVDFFNVDFWDFTIFGKTYQRWPIFNIADACVSVGVVLLIIFHREPIKDEDEKKDENFDTETIVDSEFDQVNDSESVQEIVVSTDEKVEFENDEEIKDKDGETDNRKET